MKSKIVYVRGKFRGNSEKLKDVYLYAKNMMTKYNLSPEFMGVFSDEGWYGNKLMSIKRKEKQLLKDLEEGKEVTEIELYCREMEGADFKFEKSYFYISRKMGIVLFEVNQKFIEKIDFEKILEKLKKYVEPGIEEISLWDADSIPLTYVEKGEKGLNISQKVTLLYKKITPLDIEIEI